MAKAVKDCNEAKKALEKMTYDLRGVLKLFDERAPTQK